MGETLRTREFEVIWSLDSHDPDEVNASNLRSENLFPAKHPYYNIRFDHSQDRSSSISPVKSRKPSLSKTPRRALPGDGEESSPQDPAEQTTKQTKTRICNLLLPPVLHQSPVPAQSDAFQLRESLMAPILAVTEGKKQMLELAQLQHRQQSLSYPAAAPTYVKHNTQRKQSGRPSLIDLSDDMKNTIENLNKTIHRHSAHNLPEPNRRSLDALEHPPGLRGDSTRQFAGGGFGCQPTLVPSHSSPSVMTMHSKPINSNPKALQRPTGNSVVAAGSYVPAVRPLPRSLHTLRQPMGRPANPPNFRCDKPEAKPSYELVNHVAASRRFCSARQTSLKERIGFGKGGLVYDKDGNPVTAGRAVLKPESLKRRKQSLFPATLYETSPRREKPDNFLKPQSLPDSLLGMVRFPRSPDIKFNTQHIN